MSNYNALLNNLETLKLEKMRSFLPGYLDAVSGKDVPLADAMLELTNKELEFQHERASKIQIHVAGFPFEKGLNDFDFDFQPSVNKAQIYDLATLRFMENKETNQPFSKWAEVFSDPTLANAILDRLLHHSHIIKITGPSYPPARQNGRCGS